MRKLDEAKEKAIRFEVFQRWLTDFRTRHKRNPLFEEIEAYSVELNTRQAPTSPQQLLDLEKEEKLIRRYARRLMFDEMIPYERIIIYLMPDPAGKTVILAGNPSTIQLGFTSKEIGFKVALRRLIRKAGNLWKASNLEESKPPVEYHYDTKRFTVFTDDPDYYPILSEARLQVRTYEIVEVIDLVSGESRKRSKETEIGQYSHFRNSRLAIEARLDLSRELYANGKLTKEEVTYEKDESEDNKSVAS